MKKMIFDFFWKILSWEHGKMRHYWQRPCTGKLWKRRFPSSNKVAIREFLTLFTDAFCFARADRLRFTPEDSILTVYETIYPKDYWYKGLYPRMDSMELEDLILSIDKQYGIDLSEREEDITLGDLFDLTQTPRLQTPPPRREAH